MDAILYAELKKAVLKWKSHLSAPVPDSHPMLQMLSLFRPLDLNDVEPKEIQSNFESLAYLAQLARQHAEQTVPS